MADGCRWHPLPIGQFHCCLSLAPCTSFSFSCCSLFWKGTRAGSIRPFISKNEKGLSFFGKWKPIACSGPTLLFNTWSVGQRFSTWPFYVLFGHRSRLDSFSCIYRIWLSALPRSPRATRSINIMLTYLVLMCFFLYYMMAANGNMANSDLDYSINPFRCLGISSGFLSKKWLLLTTSELDILWLRCIAWHLFSWCMPTSKWLTMEWIYCVQAFQAGMMH